MLPEIISTSSSDPLFAGIGLVVSMIILVSMIAKPIRSIFNDYFVTKNQKVVADAEQSKAVAEGFLYRQLMEQIKNNADSIKQLQGETEKWKEKAHSLESKLSELKVIEEHMEAMKKRLDEKEQMIRSRDLDIKNLTGAIKKLTERVHELELQRVTACHICGGKK